MSLLERAKKSQAIVDSLKIVESEKIAKEEAYRDSLEAAQKSYEKTPPTYDQDISPEMQTILRELEVGTAELQEEDILEGISKIKKFDSNTRGEIAEYQTDREQYEQLLIEIPQLRNTLDNLYGEVYSSLGEKLFGASDKEAEALYLGGKKKLDQLITIKDALFSKWNVAKGFTSEIQSEYESWAGKEAGGMTFYDEVRDPERFLGQAETDAPLTRFEVLQDQTQVADRKVRNLKHKIADYLQDYNMEGGADIDTMKTALEELDFQSLIRFGFDKQQGG